MVPGQPRIGAGYLVARRLDADGVNSHLVDRFGEE
jgi:branched-chain amino acid transport system substrate-binding protein